MEAWREELYANELYHHGIKGQQWGERNGPPYPLDSATHRAIIRGARKEVMKSAEDKEDRKQTEKRVVKRLIGTEAAAVGGIGALAIASGVGAIPVAAVGAVMMGASAVSAIANGVAWGYSISDVIKYGKRYNDRVNRVVDNTLKNMGATTIDDLIKESNSK